MKPFLIAFLVLCIALARAQETVLAEINADPNFSHLATALNTSTDPAVQQLATRLNDSAQMTTFFAPDNNALTASNISATYLQFSLVNGLVSPLVDKSLLSSLLLLASLGNQSQQLQITVNGANTLVSGVTVQQSINASNGQIYRVSSALTLPADLWTVVQPVAGTLASLIKLLGGESQVTANSRTVLAPSDAAFAALPAYFNTFITLNTTESNHVLTDLLGYHLGTEVFYWAKQTAPSTASLPTAEGGNLALAVSVNRTYTVETTSTVTTADLLGSNGAANVIDKVLIVTFL